MKTPSDIIRSEIKSKGIMSFARYMEAALYTPETGYYEREKAPDAKAIFTPV